MAGSRAARLQVGSAPWVAQERSSALEIAQSEVEEFTFSARNDFEWLNEHMGEIFSENHINVAEIFKTPGKLRGKTPRTVQRKANPGEARVPLSDIFSATPKGAPNPFAIPNVERNLTPKVKIAADPQPDASPTRSSSKRVSPPKLVDSGYYGSQSQDPMEVDDDSSVVEETQLDSPRQSQTDGPVGFHEEPSPEQGAQENSASPSPEPAAQENSASPSPGPTTEAQLDHVSAHYSSAQAEELTSPKGKSAQHESTTPMGSPCPSPPGESPQMHSPKKISPARPPVEPFAAADQNTSLHAVDQDVADTGLDAASRSPSDKSSPIRPVVRKSSLNFASLPAREPITHKSIGNRVSRTSHLDQIRTSYYNRHTGGKSLGNARQDDPADEDDDMDIDDTEDVTASKPQEELDSGDAAAHNKTYTQRLQDQISKLGQSQSTGSRPSKSIANGILAPTTVPEPQRTPNAKPQPSPKKPTTPGAFPEDDDNDDDWIEPLGPPDNASAMFSPRPGMPKSYSTDVMQGVSGKATVSGVEFGVPATEQRTSRPTSPQHSTPKTSFEGHKRPASVPPMSEDGLDDDVVNITKAVTVSDPPLAAVTEPEVSESPSKSHTRAIKDSPLKQVKSKLSSILKSSKGLLASSAAASAEGKSSLLSPATARPGHHGTPSSLSLVREASQTLHRNASHPNDEQPSQDQPLYPDLSKHTPYTHVHAGNSSPTRTEGRRTRASTERDKAEGKRKEKEAKEARWQAEQMQKLDKAREEEREKARIFTKERERAAAEERAAARKEQEKMVVETVVATPAPSSPSRPMRKSPRKAKEQLEAELRAAAASEDKPDEDIDMVEAPAPAPAPIPPPSVARPQAPASATKGREIKRPVRPTKEPLSKAKQAPTVIRVNMGSQYNPSSGLSSSVHETLPPNGPQSQLKTKTSQPLGKGSVQSLKSSQSSTSAARPKALEMAARRKEQEEREAQRKREAKAEIERKRAALQEEERRQEQQRRLEAERQKEEERKHAAAQAEARKNAQRQAMLEKAKQTRAPPPAVRSQNGHPDYKGARASEAQPSRPPSRMNTTAQRSQEDLSRPVNTALTSGTKATKRPLQQDPKESKRMRMTDEFDDDVDMESQPSLKGAPVRPSSGFKKVTTAPMLPPGQKHTKGQELPNKSIYPPGYTGAPQNNMRDLFKSTVTSQHNSQAKPAHPLDMAQVSKSTIPFASKPTPAGSSLKTPGRPAGVAGAKSAAKSATRSSPRFQNGETIELPEINTDDEDEYDDEEEKQMFAAWTDSPALRKALVDQETVDPMQVFGAPGPLNMEEVFSKSKERWHKFRARTSSANWSGADKLTEDDIRKDLAARDKLRREGGWSYEMSKDML